MNKNLFYLLLFASIMCGCRQGRETKGSGQDLVAPRPPMGWNSFDAYDCAIDENQFRKNVDFMADNLKQYGWEYAVIDYIWWHPDPGSWKNPRRRYGHPDIRYASDGKPLDPTTIDETGRLMPAVERFPSAEGGKGFGPLAEYVHSRGLKFGVHIMRGVHRHAVWYNLPVRNTSFTAAGIADMNDTCSWCNHMYGVDPGKPGAQEYYDSLFELYALWGIDFVKVDDISAKKYHDGEIELIRRAIDKCGRKIVLSLSPGETPVEKASHLAENANMWRISADFWDEWDKLKYNFTLLEKWYPYTKEGRWPDADMLPAGRLSLKGRPHGPERDSHFTWPEHYTLFTLWMIAKSPLIMGGDLPTTSDSTLFFLRNPETIAVNQLSTGNRQLFRNDSTAAWIADNPAGGKYLALFNLSDSELSIKFSAGMAGLDHARVRDLWKRQDLEAGKEFSISLLPHGAGLYSLSNN